MVHVIKSSRFSLSFSAWERAQVQGCVQTHKLANRATKQVQLTVSVSFLLVESACFRIGNSCRMVSCRREQITSSYINITSFQTAYYYMMY